MSYTILLANALCFKYDFEIRSLYLNRNILQGKHALYPGLATIIVCSMAQMAQPIKQGTFPNVPWRL